MLNLCPYIPLLFVLESVDAAIGSLSPCAAAASRLIKSGMTLTQIYTQYASVSEELIIEKEENRRLNLYVSTIVKVCVSDWVQRLRLYFPHNHSRLVLWKAFNRYIFIQFFFNPTGNKHGENMPVERLQYHTVMVTPLAIYLRKNFGQDHAH